MGSRARGLTAPELVGPHLQSFSVQYFQLVVLVVVI